MSVLLSMMMSNADVGELYETKILSQANASKGWAYQCKSTRQNIAKASVPTVYADIKDKYDNAAEELSSLTKGQSLNSQNGCAYSNGYYFIVQDAKLYYSTSPNGTYTILDDSDISGNTYSNGNIFAGDNILVCRVFNGNTGDKIRIIDTHNLSNKKNIANVSDFEFVKRVFKVGTTLYIFTPYNKRKVYSIEDNYSATSVSTAKTFNYDVYDIYEDNGEFYQLATNNTIRKSTTITGTYTTIYTDTDGIYEDSFIAVKGNFICWLEGRGFPIKYTTDNFATVSQTLQNEDIGYASGMKFLPIIFNGLLYYRDENANKVCTRAINNFSTKTQLSISQNNEACSVMTNLKAIVFVADYIYYAQMEKVAHTDSYLIDGVSVTITYYPKDDFKICLSDNGGTNDTNLATVYSSLGYYDYFVLDLTNETISLPRKSDLYAVMYVGDNYQDTYSSEISYLQSDGAIYIPLCESGETLNVKKFKLDIEFLNNTTDKNVYFGVFYSVSGTQKSYGIIGKSSIAPDIIMFFDGTATGQTIASMNRQVIEKSFSSQRTIDNTWGLFGGNYTLTYTPTIIGYAICKIRSLILYDNNGNEVANLLPKEENGVLGLYDSVRNKFIAGVGSGSFIAG